MQYDCEQAYPRAGPGQVCAQPRTNPTKSDDQNFNLPSTRVVDQIRWVRASTDVGVDRSESIIWKMARIRPRKDEK